MSHNQQKRVQLCIRQCAVGPTQSESLNKAVVHFFVCLRLFSPPLPSLTPRKLVE